MMPSGFDARDKTSVWPPARDRMESSGPPSTTPATGSVSYEGLCWPTTEQRALLKALFAPPDIALPSFESWRATLDLDRLDSGSLSLMPLLYRRMTDLGIDDPIQPRLRGARHYHWCRNEVRLRQCFQGIDTLLAAGHPVLALKGLAALDLYGDIGLRPMADVDVLVPRERAGAAFDALLADGWRPKDGTQRSQLPLLMRQLHGYGFGKNKAELDLHWTSLVEDLSSQADEGLWKRAQRRTLWGRQLLVPCITDLLLHTCVHGARFSRAMSVNWVPDTVRIIETRASDVDWSLLVAEAQRRVLELPVRETLRFLKEELRSAVPDGVLDALKPREPAWLFWLDHHLFAADPQNSTSWHRAAARVVSRLRRGLPMPSDLAAEARAAARAGG